MDNDKEHIGFERKYNELKESIVSSIERSVKELAGDINTKYYKFPEIFLFDNIVLSSCIYNSYAIFPIPILVGTKFNFESKNILFHKFYSENSKSIDIKVDFNMDSFLSMKNLLEIDKKLKQFIQL